MQLKYCYSSTVPEPFRNHKSDSAGVVSSVRNILMFLRPFCIMRIALKVAYLGTDYHGFQVQPNMRTIEGEFLASLKKLDLIRDSHESNYRASGRTDKGVHAIGQVVAFDTCRPELAIPGAINSNISGNCWTWARAEVPDGFDPRRDARFREYLYIIPGGVDGAVLDEASSILNGEHDFFNFITPEKDRGSLSHIYDINFQYERDFLIMQIKASHFLWHMVRKIATAIGLIGRGSRDIPWLIQMLNPEKFKEALEPAPAYGLIMKKVEYSGIDWKEDAYARKRALRVIREEFLKYNVMSGMLKEFDKSMKGE